MRGEEAEDRRRGEEAEKPFAERAFTAPAPAIRGRMGGPGDASASTLEPMLLSRVPQANTRLRSFPCTQSTTTFGHLLRTASCSSSTRARTALTTHLQKRTDRIQYGSLARLLQHAVLLLLNSAHMTPDETVYNCGQHPYVKLDATPVRKC